MHAKQRSRKAEGELKRERRELCAMRAVSVGLFGLRWGLFRQDGKVVLDQQAGARTICAIRLIKGVGDTAAAGSTARATRRIDG